MENLRVRLYEAIEEYGLFSDEVLILSQMLDAPVADEQMKRYEKYKRERQVIYG